MKHMPTPLVVTLLPDGTTLTKLPDPFSVGQPGDSFDVIFVNQHSEPHRIKLHKFKHKKTGKMVDPLKQDPTLAALGGVSAQGTFATKPTATNGYYDYVVELDGVDVTDPEIVVDPPDKGPHHGGGKKKAASKKTVGAKKKAVAKKTTAGKKKTAARKTTAKRRVKRAAKKKR